MSYRMYMQFLYTIQGGPPKTSTSNISANISHRALKKKNWITK